MKKIAHLVSFCLLLVLTTEVFAKSVDPIRHAAGSAEARLALDSFKGRILNKFSGLSDSHKESVLYGMYRLGVKTQNKLQSMDVQKIAAKLNAKADSDTSAQAVLSDDEAAASEFVSESVSSEGTSQMSIQGSQVEGFLEASAQALASVGTPMDANGKFKRLGRADFMKSVRQQLLGDGNWEGLGQALVAFFVGIVVLLALGAAVIIGLSAVAFGLPGALISAAVIGLILIVVLNG